MALVQCITFHPSHNAVATTGPSLLHISNKAIEPKTTACIYCCVDQMEEEEGGHVLAAHTSLSKLQQSPFFFFILIPRNA
jgi:hypothetical protein